MRALLLAALLVTVGVVAVAEPVAAQPGIPPLVGQCNAVTTPCWDGALLCVWFSLQVPQCVDFH
jgi:hypothetical protein